MVCCTRGPTKKANKIEDLQYHIEVSNQSEMYHCDSKAFATLTSASPTHAEVKRSQGGYPSKHL